jgi:starch phosphorylase
VAPPPPSPRLRDGSQDLERAVAELGERLPPPLAPLARLAFDYRWTWLPGGAGAFAHVDPVVWQRSCGNPRWLLETVPPQRLRELAGDPDYVKRVVELAARLDAERARPAAALGPTGEGPVAYFCSEFGAHGSLPLYGGGLGVLAGDFLKGASDLGLPVVGVGLLYREGYFHQRLDADGWQHEYWVRADFERLPAVLVTGDDGRPLQIELPLRGRKVQIQVWRIDFGRVPLYLLDTDRPDNHPIDRWITARLYIGDRHTRLAQYAVLGVGGARALARMGIEPRVFHLNEGHAGLVALERLAPLLAAGASAEEALARIAARTVFTTHTPVAAGNEWYELGEVEPVLDELRESLGLPRELAYGLGGLELGMPGAPLSITPLALRTSRVSNGVSRRHGEVARRMWQGVWPGRAESEVPITHVTNGVHTATWMAEPMQELLDRHLGPGWRARLAQPALWQGIAAIPDEALWAVRNVLRAQLVAFARERSVFDRLGRGEPPEYVEAAARVFDPDTLTIGFARRVATYKRLHLLTRRLDVGLRLLADRVRPIQLIIAGKAHPQDTEAKQTLQALLRARRAPNVGGHIVFVEDYDLRVAPCIVAGVDLWLNLPRPPLEACGTSGMKVALNGGLNLSVLDGWWEEAYDGECGWAIASPDGDPSLQDDRDAAAAFNLIENEVLPLFYDRGADGIPHRWLARVKTSLARLAPRFSAERMLRDYAERVYA